MTIAASVAALLLRSLRGARRVALSTFYTGYRKSVLAADELIEAIEIDLPPEGSAFVWRKVGTPQAQAISKVALAGLAVVESGRAKRLGLGRPIAEITDADVERAVLADVSPIDDIPATAAYRRHVAVRLVQRFLEELQSR
ncbi:MAG: FAD binding domain-containing protein [Holophagales bacterium]|nr:FAD binding domain-containing protein [Holophagales bacterium]